MQQGRIGLVWRVDEIGDGIPQTVHGLSHKCREPVDYSRKSGKHDSAEELSGCFVFGDYSVAERVVIRAIVDVLC